MIIVKRTNGSVSSKFIAEAGKVTVQIPSKQELSASKDESKSKTAKAPKAPKDEPKAKKGREPKSILAKLDEAIALTDVSKRSKKCFDLGKAAWDLGPADPEVMIAFERARKDQLSYRAEGDRSATEGSDEAFYSWSAAFIAGYNAPVSAKGTPTPKPYLLTVVIPGERAELKSDSTETEEYRARFESFGDAFRAAVRWYNLKSTVAHRMVVTIDQIDLSVPVEKGQPLPIIEKLKYNVTLLEARSASLMQTKREKKGPVVFIPKAKGKLSFGVKVKESRCSFSHG